MTHHSSGVNRVRLTSQKLTKHELQDTAVSVVEGLLRRVDSYQCVKFLRNAINHRPHRDLPSGRKLLNEISHSTNLKRFLATQGKRFGVFTGKKLQRQDAHSHQIGSVDALITLGNDGADAQQTRPLGGPVARRP